MTLHISAPLPAPSPLSLRLQRRETGRRVGEVAVTARLYGFRTRRGRGQKCQYECGRNDQPDKFEEGDDKAFQHGTIPL